MLQQNLDGPFIRACAVSVSASATMSLYLCLLFLPFRSCSVRYDVLYTGSIRPSSVG